MRIAILAAILIGATIGLSGRGEGDGEPPSRAATRSQAIGHGGGGSLAAVVARPSGAAEPAATPTTAASDVDGVGVVGGMDSTAGANAVRGDIDGLFAVIPNTPRLWKALKKAKCSMDWGATVKHQLGQWQETGFTQRQVDEFCVKHAFRASLVNGELRMSYVKPRDNKNVHRVLCGLWLMWMAALRASARGNPIPALEIQIQPGDTAFSLTLPRKSWKNPGPALGNIKCTGASVSFPLTIHDQFGFGTGRMSLERYHERFNEAKGWEEGESATAWADKAPQSIFSGPRGSGQRGNRSKIFKLKSEFLNTSTSPMKVEEFTGFRSNVYAYGHCGWSRRIHELVMMKTVVMMEHSICREYMHGVFEPGKDHIAVAEDFSDLPAKLETLFTSADQGKAMAERWYRRGLDIMSLPCTLDYVEAILREYARLQRFEPVYHPEWPLFDLDKNLSFFDEPGMELDSSSCTPPKFDYQERAHAC